MTLSKLLSVFDLLYRSSFAVILQHSMDNKRLMVHFCWIVQLGPEDEMGGRGRGGMLWSGEEVVAYCSSEVFRVLTS